MDDEYKRCENCRYYVSYVYEFNDSDSDHWISDYGECRRFPPVDGLNEEAPVFPVVQKECWCGEFDN